MDQDGSQLAFIVGHYKSGSSWLAYLLSLHPGIRSLRETHVFRYSSAGDLAECTRQLYSAVSWAEGGRRNLIRNRLAASVRPFRRRGQATLSWRDRPSSLLDLSLIDQERLRRTLLACDDVDEYRRLFFGFLHRALRPPRYLLEKTPTNIHFVPEIRRVFPRSKLIAIYRDGRDVVMSDRFHLKRVYGRTQDFPESVTTWKEAMDAQLAYAEPFDILTLSYESMLEDSEAAAKRILRFLELDVRTERVATMVGQASFEFITGRKPGQENGQSFFRKGVSGDWVHGLTEGEKRLFSELAGETLVALGYEDSPDWTQW